MSDCEKLVVDDHEENEEEVKICRSKKKSKVSDRDDLSGMALNMFSKIDPREIFILWGLFIVLHSELFADWFLKKFKGTTNEDKTMTMKGTMYASIVMMVAIVICAFVF